MNFLNKTTVTIRDTEFEVSELPASEMLPMVHSQGDEGLDYDAQSKLIMASVSFGGEKFDDETIRQLPTQMHMELLRVVMEVNALTSPEEEVGND